MPFLNSLNISGSGLTASRLRMDVISENIANATTTRTEGGGPYKRKIVIYESMDGKSFDGVYQNKLFENTAKGVKVAEIAEDQSAFNPVYDPDNPDADANGYVLMPNVDIVEETIDMMSVTRAYEANLTAFNAMKKMAEKALEIQGE